MTPLRARDTIGLTLVPKTPGNDVGGRIRPPAARRGISGRTENRLSPGFETGDLTVDVESPMRYDYGTASSKWRPSQRVDRKGAVVNGAAPHGERVAWPTFAAAPSVPADYAGARAGPDWASARTRGPQDTGPVD